MSLLIFHLRKATKTSTALSIFQTSAEFCGIFDILLQFTGWVFIYFLNIMLPKKEKYYLQKQFVIFILLNQYSHFPPFSLIVPIKEWERNSKLTKDFTEIGKCKKLEASINPAHIETSN